MTLHGRHAIVLGLGLTGFSLARHLARHGAIVRVADTRPVPPFAARLAAELPGIPLRTGPIDEHTLAGADLIAISPGIAKDQPAIAAAVARGAELVGDIELFARAVPADCKVLAVTGSNGKTTVTALTGELCRAAGLATVVAGNIGDAALDALADIELAGRRPDVVVLELSSFQLETTSSLVPHAATVLNITENHLDRYPDMDAYAAAKARIFAGEGVQVLNRDDPRSLAMRIPGRIVETFGAGVPMLEDAWGLVAHGGGTWLARGGQLLVPTADMALVGRHNALNALAALALVSTVAPVRRNELATLTRFQAMPHRMQRIDEIGGVLYVNDSKGTTVVATEVALTGLARPVVLIAGGDGKGQDFAALKPAVDAHCRAVLLVGRDAPALERALAGTPAHVERVGTLDAAVPRAIALARPGDVVLLSPACASLDQFGSYVERGDRFVALVRAATTEAAHA
jgi:UDP-N-acetylmuramoylalanine--D-glutamate ligase